MRRREAGFSLVELIVVVAIAIIVMAIAVPAVKRTVTSYQLDASSRAVASMLQTVRSAAVKNETPYYAQFNGAAGPNVVFAESAAQLNANAVYDPTIDPATSINGNIVFPAGAPPAHAQLETAMGVSAGTIVRTGGPISFNSRGIPCLQNGTAWQCTTTPPVAFEWFMQNSMSGTWAAITVSPAGRIKSWRMSGNGVWQ
jgi:Tfp pilus assembly protein FimT